jgi:hypothetical protein
MKKGGNQPPFIFNPIINLNLFMKKNYETKVSRIYVNGLKISLINVKY